MRTRTVAGPALAHLTIFAIGFAALAGHARASEPAGASARRAYVHWSEPKKMVSPDGAWELAVFPIYDARENGSPVVVRRRRGGRAKHVLTLERDANVYWGGANRLLIIDHPTTIPRRVLLFRLESTGNVTRLRATPDLDADIRHRVLGALGRTESVEFFIPTFASWAGSRLVLMLGGTVVYKATAPHMTPYCYRITVDSRAAKVEGMAKEPVRDEGTKCQIFP